MSLGCAMHLGYWLGELFFNIEGIDVVAYRIEACDYYAVVLGFLPFVRQCFGSQQSHVLEVQFEAVF